MVEIDVRQDMEKIFEQDQSVTHSTDESDLIWDEVFDLDTIRQLQPSATPFTAANVDYFPCLSVNDDQNELSSFLADVNLSSVPSAGSCAIFDDYVPDYMDIGLW